MTICEGCGTENLEGSRFCDACSAAIWLAGRSSGSLHGAQGNGSNGKGRQEPATVGRGASLVSEEQTSVPPFETGNRVHATLVIERGTSAGKKFSLSAVEANIGRWDADGG